VDAHSGATRSGAPPRKPPISPEAFFEVDVRVGRVLAVEPLPAARKPSWKLEVDFGAPVGVLRTGAQVTNYTPDELVGRAVVGAINLGTKRIAGFSSEFLVLGAIDGDGTVHLLGVEDAVEPGTPVA
jgi:tRNA-binding protein